MATGSLQVKNGKYYAVLNFKDSEGKRKQKWISLNMEVKNNKRKAEQALKELLAEYEGSDYVEPSKMLFCDFLKNWVELNKPNVQITTYDGYQHMLNKHIYPYFKEKNIKLSKIQPMDIQRYYSDKLNTGLSPNTVIKHHGIIRTALQYAVKSKLIRENIADLVDKPKRERYHAAFYTLEELNKLLDVSKGSTIETPVLFAAYYGLRRSEILGLKWEAIDFTNRTISICNKVVRGKDKNGKLSPIPQDKMKTETSRRILPLCDTIAEYLTILLEKQRENVRILGNCYNQSYSDYICVNAQGDLINPDYVTDTFGKLLEKNGLRHIRFHDLRHSCASLLVSLGYSMKDVQEWLGHSDYTLTANTYSHVDLSEKFKMIDSVNKNFTFSND
ncbi:MAG: site-specific integrase [Ruminococcus sp.]|nr:site-specific integrase [Ruminococcus sp.]